MSRIGAAWWKGDKNDKPFLSVTFEEALLPLTITQDKRIILVTNPNKTQDNHPDFYVDLFIPKKQEDKG